MSKLRPCLWFNGDAEEAANFYVSLLPNSAIKTVQRNVIGQPAGKAGSVLVVEFTVAGQRFMALNGGMKMEYTHALSFNDPLRRSGPGRPGLGCAVLAHGGKAAAMRLAQGSLRRVLADRAEGDVRISRRARTRPLPRAPCRP